MEKKIADLRVVTGNLDTVPDGIWIQQDAKMGGEDQSILISLNIRLTHSPQESILHCVPAIGVDGH